jgi:phage gp29-like protein
MPTGEIATRLNALGFDLASALGWLPDPDPILRDRGDDIEVLRDLMADEQVTQCVQSRKVKTLNLREYSFTPGHAQGAEPDATAKRICEDLTHDMGRVDMETLLSGVLDAPYYGFTPVELVWEGEAGKVRLVKAEPKPCEWFGFNEFNQPVFIACSGVAETITPGKMVLARHFPSYRNPYGLRLLARCLWPVAFKKGGIEFWMTFLERYGQPWVLGHGAPGDRQSQLNEMAANLAAMVRDAVAVVPADAQVSAVDFKARGGEHKESVDYWDRAISKVLTGQTLSSDIGDVGSQAAAQTHYQAFQDFADADRAMVENVMNGIARAYVQVQGLDIPAPVFRYAKQKDLTEVAERGEKLHNQGVRFTKVYYQRHFGLEEDEFEVIEQEDKSGSFAAPQSPAFTPDQQVLEDMVAEVVPRGSGMMRQVAGKIGAIIAAATSFEDLKLQLAEAMGQDLGEDQLQDLMQQAEVAARMWGRFQVRKETE